MSAHDHLCESKRLVAPVPYGMCRCISRAWENDPLPEEEMPIYPPYVLACAPIKPPAGGWHVQISTARQYGKHAAAQAWADRQITPEEMQTGAPPTDSVYTSTNEEGTS
jgi:hypothetical protein